MLRYYVSYLGNEIFKKLINIGKYTGLIYQDFHLFSIDDKLYVSSLPTREYRSVVSNFDVVIGFLGENEYGNSEVNWIKDTQIKYYNISVPDYNAPTHEDYHKLFRILDSHQNQRILIHCFAGKGRSNCGAAAYLMYKNRYSAEEAINMVERKNSRSSMNYYQKWSLKELEKVL